MSVLERIDAEVRTNGHVSLESIGGETELWGNESELVGSPSLLPYAIDLICREWKGLSRSDASAFALASVRDVHSPLAFADAADRLLACAPLLEDVGVDLAGAFLERASAAAATSEDEISVRSLEGALRLVLGAWSDRRFDLLAALTRQPVSLSPSAGARLCRLIGISDEHWPAAEFVAALEDLVERNVSAADASFELGLAELRRALTAGAFEDILDGLARAQVHFDSADATIEDRTDAQVYSLALTAVLGFARNSEHTWLSSVTDRLRETIIGRLLWRPTHEESWLAPRIEAELEWQRLTEMLARAARQSELDDDWLDPPTVLAQLMETYNAQRSVRLFAWRADAGSGIASLIEPRIENAFLEETLRVKLLSRWLETSDEIAESDRAAAAQLLEALQAGGSKKARRQRGFRRR